MQLTEADRQQLLDKAVEAVGAWLADTTPRVRATHSQDTRQAPESRRLYTKAVKAVTEAVTTGGHIHTLITVRVRQCPGMTIVQMITDLDAYASALAVERHAAEVYGATVRDAIRREALRRVGAGEDKKSVAGRLNITRQTIYTWLEEARDGGGPSTPWDAMRPGPLDVSAV